MPQAIVDPEELRRFARVLKEFSTVLRDRLAAISSQLAALGKTWRDQEHEKFAEEFAQHMRAMSHFLEVTEQHVTHLLRKAERIDQYLQQR